MRLIDRISFAKITTILAISFGIGMGLCGLSLCFRPVVANGA